MNLRKMQGKTAKTIIFQKRSKKMSIYYTIEEAAKILKVTKRTVNTWVKDGRIRASKLANNKNIRISEEALQAFLTATEIKA